jgi:hypothetical protein
LFYFVFTTNAAGLGRIAESSGEKQVSPGLSVCSFKIENCFHVPAGSVVRSVSLVVELLHSQAQVQMPCDFALLKRQS